jgi:lysophospholipase L1-like esterase
MCARDGLKTQLNVNILYYRPTRLMVDDPTNSQHGAVRTTGDGIINNHNADLMMPIEKQNIEVGKHGYHDADCGTRVPQQLDNQTIVTKDPPRDKRRPSHPRDRMEDYLFYDEQNKMSIRWSPKKSVTGTADIISDVKVQQAGYSLNEDKLMKKKLQSCDRTPLIMEMKGDNAVVKSSTLTFEMIKSVLYEYYERKTDICCEITQKEDENNKVEHDKLAIFNRGKTGKKGKHLYTINLYRTTSTVMINGSHLSKFLTSEYPRLEKFINNNYNICDEQLLKNTINQLPTKGAQTDPPVNRSGQSPDRDEESLVVLSNEHDELADGETTPSTPKSNGRNSTPKSLKACPQHAQLTNLRKFHNKTPQLISPKRMDNFEKILTNLNDQAVKNNDKLTSIETQLHNKIDEAIHQSKLAVENLHQIRLDISNQCKETDKLRLQLKNLTKEKDVLENKLENLDVATNKQIRQLEKQVNQLIEKASAINIPVTDQINDLEQKIRQISVKPPEVITCDHNMVNKLEQTMSNNEKEVTNLKKAFAEFTGTILQSLESINPSARLKERSSEPQTDHINDGNTDETPHKPVIFKSSVQSAQGSRFQAFCCAISNQIELDAFVASIDQTYPDTHSANHHIVSYTFTKPGETIVQADDDGEHGASERVLDVIRDNKLQNVATMVCRWYGGKHTGQLPFKLIAQCLLEALKTGTFITGSNSVKPKSVLILSDSTGAGINVNRMMPGGSCRRDTAPTLDSCITKLKVLPGKYDNIIIQCGINDVEALGLHQTSKKVKDVLDTAKQHHPRSNIHICSLLPYRAHDDGSIAEMNRSINACAQSKHCKFIDIYSRFHQNQDMYRGNKHPNVKGTAVIVSAMKKDIGLATKESKYQWTHQRSTRSQIKKTPKTVQAPFVLNKAEFPPIHNNPKKDMPEESTQNRPQTCPPAVPNIVSVPNVQFPPPHASMYPLHQDYIRSMGAIWPDYNQAYGMYHHQFQIPHSYYGMHNNRLG